MPLPCRNAVWGLRGCAFPGDGSGGREEVWIRRGRIGVRVLWDVFGVCDMEGIVVK